MSGFEALRPGPTLSAVVAIVMVLICGILLVFALFVANVAPHGNAIGIRADAGQAVFAATVLFLATAMYVTSAIIIIRGTVRTKYGTSTNFSFNARLFLWASAVIPLAYAVYTWVVDPGDGGAQISSVLTLAYAICVSSTLLPQKNQIKAEE